jgi:hypothetical protein
MPALVAGIPLRDAVRCLSEMAGTSPAMTRKFIRPKVITASAHILTPRSFKYLTAPGCQGIGVFLVC